jgi:hypothetical protein
MLGLTPEASDEEIARAFAREIGRPRAFGGIALVGLAYETLRDPVKREAYDVSLGLRPECEPEPQALPADAVAAWREGSSFFAFASARPAQHPPAPTTPFIAALAPRAVEPAPPPPRPVAEPARPAEPEAMPKPDLAQELRLSASEHQPAAWIKPAIAGGGLVVAVVLMGAFAGWNAGNGEASQAEPAVKVALPPTGPRPATVNPLPAPASEVADAEFRQPPHAAMAPARVKRSPPKARPGLPVDFLAQADPVEGAQSGDVSTAAAVAETPPVETPAALPLPEPVIARTIERIGYSCGKVASASAATGGVYKVTCTSGASYQATPVRGRYHFRRLGRN